MNFQIVPISLAAYMSGETQRLSCKSWELLTVPRMLFSVTFFGKKEGSHYTEGLVDSTSNGMYNTVFDALFENWKKLDVSTSSLEKFVQWFAKYKSPVVKSSTLKCVRNNVDWGHHLLHSQKMPVKV